MRQYLKLGHSASFKILFHSLFTIQSLDLLIVRGTDSIIKLDINNTNTEALLTSKVEIKLSAFSMEAYDLCIDRPKVFGI
jgi:hypothetical protein